MIELQDVRKHYVTDSGEVRALDGVSLQVAAGEFVAVRGPSGCGKSTLLALLGGLAQPTSGKVIVDGTDLFALSMAQRAEYRAQQIGFVFQMFHLLPYLNVMDNVLVSASSTDSKVKAHAQELLECFDLADRMGHVPSQLSAGERQRVAMARALLNRPKLLLADEPTGNLDPENASALLDLLGDFQQEGGTIFLVTHEEQAAARADRSIMLRSGKLDVEAAISGAQDQ